MRKKIFIIIEVLIISFFFTLSLKASILSDIIPTELKNIELEMNYTDFKLNYPEAKTVGNASEAFCILEFSNDDMWSGSSLIFKNGKLKYLSLIRQTPENEIDVEQYFNVNQKVVPTLEKIIKILGKKIIPKINKKKDNTIIYYEPVIVWKSGKNEVCLNYTPQKNLKSALVPHVTLSIISEGENFSFYFKELFESNDGQISFKDILDENIKTLLYDSSEVIIK